MALTQSEWTETFVNGAYVAKCNVLPTTNESDVYTKKTPPGLDPSKPWTVSFYSAIGADNTVPIDIWVGWNDKFALSGDGSGVTAGAHGSNYKNIMDDAVAAIAGNPYTWIIDPYLTVADVITASAIAGGLKVKVPIAPYYAFNVDGGTVVATINYWIITQKTDKVGI